jgi:hypothetical protein
MKRSGIVYRHRVDATPEAEISTLTNIYRFVLDCHAKKRGRTLDESGPEDVKGRSESDFHAKTRIP